MIGRVVGNYQILEKLGEGGMGSVYRAMDVMLEREVAIKILRPELAGQADILERFRTEAIILARLNHPSIATLYSLAREAGELMMVMEFVRGATLERVLGRVGAIPTATALQWCGHVLEAMQYAHAKGVVHRDLKPANLMVTESGTIKVMDFGIARVLGTSRQTRTGRIIGTIAYMAPEQIRGQEADARTDIYALGIVLYEMITGRLPFQAPDDFALMVAQVNEAPPTPTSIAPHLPAWLDQTLLRALSKDPAQRFSNATEFRAAFEEALRREPIDASQTLAVDLVIPPLVPAAADTAPTFEAPSIGGSGQAMAPPAGETRLATPRGSVPGLERRSSGGFDANGATRQADVPPATRLADVPPATRLAEPPPTRLAAAPAPQAGAAPEVRAFAFGPFHYVAAAVVLVLAVALAVVLLRGGGGQPAPATETAATTPPPPVPPPAAPAPADSQAGGGASGPSTQPPAPPRVAETLTPFVLPGETRPPTSAPRGSEAKPAPIERARTPSGVRPSPPPSSPPATPPATVAPPRDAPAEPEAPARSTARRPARSDVSFERTGLLVDENEEQWVEDAELLFRPEALVVRFHDSERPPRSLSYRSISKAVYSAVKRTGITGFFRKGSNHWLTLHTAKGEWAIRLDAKNYQAVIDELEMRIDGRVDIEK